MSTTVGPVPAQHWSSFTHDAASVPRARRAVRSVLDGAGVDQDAVAEIEIVLSEMVGNAVRHARPLDDGGIHVRCLVVRDHRAHVEIAVTDGGAPGRGVSRRVLDDSSTSGRGLCIVDVLAHEWGVVENLDDLSRTVWASFGGPTRLHPR